MRGPATVSVDNHRVVAVAAERRDTAERGRAAGEADVAARVSHYVTAVVMNGHLGIRQSVGLLACLGAESVGCPP